MENESLPKPMPEQMKTALDQNDEELVRRTAQNAERLAVALGLPREAKYEVLAALGGGAVMPTAVAQLQSLPAAQAVASPATTPQLPALVVEVARGAKHAAEYVRTFLAGETPPAFRPVAVAFQFMGKMGPADEPLAPTEPVALDVAGPVVIAVAQAPATNAATLELRLRDPAAGSVAVRLFRGWEGGERPLAPVAAFELSAAQPTATHPLGPDDDAVRVEVERPE